MREDLDNWRDQNGRAISPREMKIWMQHAFGFMEVSGRKTDFREEKEGGGGAVE